MLPAIEAAVADALRAPVRAADPQPRILHRAPGRRTRRCPSPPPSPIRSTAALQGRRPRTFSGLLPLTFPRPRRLGRGLRRRHRRARAAIRRSSLGQAPRPVGRRHHLTCNLLPPRPPRSICTLLLRACLTHLRRRRHAVHAHRHGLQRRHGAAAAQQRRGDDQRRRRAAQLRGVLNASGSATITLDAEASVAAGSASAACSATCCAACSACSGLQEETHLGADRPARRPPGARLRPTPPTTGSSATTGTRCLTTRSRRTSRRAAPRACGANCLTVATATRRPGSAA